MARLLLTLCCALSVVAGCKQADESSRNTSNSQSSTAPSGGMLTIAVIPKGSTHAFWQSVKAGAQKAADESGVEMIWKAPLLENDRAQQISIVEQFTSQGINGIVLAPLDDTALRRPVKEAGEAHIPVLIIDSALKGEAGKDFVSFVATDNKTGGTMAGEHLATLLNGKGKIVLLRYQQGSASTMDREAGFLEAVGRHPDMHLLVSNRYGGPTADKALTAAVDLMDKLQEADGIFCSNESTTVGMLLALRQNNLAGKVKFVGFDASDKLIEGLRKSEIDALVAQNPTRMGYEGVKTLVDHLRGKTVPLHIDSGVKLVTRPDLDNPEVKQFLGL